MVRMEADTEMWLLKLLLFINSPNWKLEALMSGPCNLENQGTVVFGVCM